MKKKIKRIRTTFLKIKNQEYGSKDEIKKKLKFDKKRLRIKIKN